MDSSPLNWELTAEHRDRFFELTLDMLCISSGDGYFKWLNPAFSTTLGWSMSELLSHPYTYFVHPDDLANTLNEVERQMKAGERVFHFENRYRHKDGSWRVLAWKSTPFGGLMYAVARDVTEQNRLKSILQASNVEVQELQRRVERAAKIGHWYWRGSDSATNWRDGTSEYSDSGLAILGLAPDDKRFTNQEFIQHFVHSDDQALVEQAFDSATAEGGYALEYRIVRPDGEVRIIYERAEHLTMENGAASLSSGILQDITDKRAAEEAFKASVIELRRAEQQLQQAQKLDAVGQLTAGIAHDFNNLLSVVVGNLEIALEDMNSASQNAQVVTRALDAALHGAVLTHRLLAFSRQQALEPKAFVIDDLLPDIVTVLKRTLGAGISVNLVAGKGLWPAFADPSPVQDAVLNLAINARDAMPHGGTLTIETANVSLDDDYSRHNPDVKPGDYALLAVTDTGTGIPPEIMKRVMEPFFTTKPEGMGTGLGLSMIYGFARQSGGHLKLYSEPGHGTTVKLYLPRARGSADGVQQVAHHQDSPPQGNEHVLVVEDNDQLRKTAVMMLEKLGYRVSKAENGEAALAFLKGAGQIDLLFSDIVMTGRLTGRDLAESVKKLRPRMKILLTTGYAEKASVEGAQGWPILNKPYRKQELAKRVREILDSGD